MNNMIIDIRMGIMGWIRSVKQVTVSGIVLVLLLGGQLLNSSDYLLGSSLLFGHFCFFLHDFSDLFLT